MLSWRTLFGWTLKKISGRQFQKRPNDNPVSIIEFKVEDFRIIEDLGSRHTSDFDTQY
jgi:hypothetical protein